MMAWLATTKQSWILCLQEPYLKQRGITKLPQTYTAFWTTRQTTTHKTAQVTNTAIIAPKEMNAYMVSQHSDVNCVIIRLDSINISVISLYCSVHDKINDSVNLVKCELELGKQVIICADVNAHHQLWGSKIQRNRLTVADYRGKTLMNFIDEQELALCNILPHQHTFVSELQDKSSHIDITLVSERLLYRIADWTVHDETMDSDHRYITFTVLRTSECIFQGGKDGPLTPWKKPNAKMYKVMTERLKEIVVTKKKLKGGEEVENYVQAHTEEIQRALHIAFKKRNKRKEKAMYWWNDEINEAYEKMKKARKRKSRYGYEGVREEFNRCRKHFRYLMRKAKTASWQKFTTEIKDPWSGLMKILSATNCGKSLSKTLCDSEGNYSGNLKETLISLSTTFYPPPAPILQVHEEIINYVNVRLQHQNREHTDITREEFKMALEEMSTATAPGFDTVTNNIIQYLARERGYETQYISLFNECLKNMIFPSAWKVAKVVLIPKNHTIADSVKALRSISLTSAFGKLLERIVLARINFYLQSSRRMSLNQHAYRKGCSTQTALYQVFGYVHEAFEQKQVCVAVFMDISGAFDRTWHEGILYNLLQYGVPENLVNFIKNFLQGRTAIFQQGNEEHEVTLKQGCPQGGVLSPALWNVLFNELLCIQCDEGEDIEIVAYADDAVILSRGKTVKNASKVLTKYLGKVHEWSIRNRVVFNSAKLATMTFYGYSRYRAPPPSEVYYNNVLVMEVSQYKYLGLLVDNRLRWKYHIEVQISKLQNIMRMLRGAVRERWGIKTEIMRVLYHAIFIPIMTYGIAIWGWRAQTLEVQQMFNTEIRKFCLMATRCFKSTSSMIIHKMMKTSDFLTILQNSVRRTTLLQLRLINKEMRENQQEGGAGGSRRSMQSYHAQCNSSIRVEKEVVYDDYEEIAREHPAERRQTMCTIKEKTTAIWKSVSIMGWCIYTDASASSYGMGWAIVILHHGFCIAKKSAGLSKCSVFEAEAYAILQAIRFTECILDLKEEEKIEIRTDALSVVAALGNIISTDPILIMIKKALKSVYEKGINVVIVWVPGHCGVFGNECADQMARLAVDSKNTYIMDMHGRQVVRIIKEEEKRCAEVKWENYTAYIPKLFFPSLNNLSSFLKCSPSVPLMQLVSGHTRLNKFAYKIYGMGSTPMCTCNEEEETTEHYLFRCPNYDSMRDEIWPEFQQTFSYITSDWEKLDQYVESTKRFFRLGFSCRHLTDASTIVEVEE